MHGDILLVDDNPGIIQLMGRILARLGQLRFATSGALALQKLRERPPDVVLLDAEMPGMSGYEVCEQMKIDPALCDIPVIFVSAHDGHDQELRGLNLGAVDFIAKPVSEPLLLARVRTHLRVKRLNDELRRIATTDALTEVYNRRAFDEALGRESKRALRAGAPISLLLVDIDHFKLFNDRYGHPSGDACLRSVAQALCVACRRPADMVVRYGGEEFALLLPATPPDGAIRIAHRVLAAVAALDIAHATSPTAPRVSASAGIACYDHRTGEPVADYPADGHDRCLADELIRAADRALYEAKRAGRNQAWLYSVDGKPGARKVVPDGEPASP